MIFKSGLGSRKHNSNHDREHFSIEFIVCQAPNINSFNTHIYPILLKLKCWVG